MWRLFQKRSSTGTTSSIAVEWRGKEVVSREELAKQLGSKLAKQLGSKLDM
jgi:hypothetical protein